MTWKKGEYRAGLVQASRLSAGIHTFPWPREIPGFGRLAVISFTQCSECRTWTFAQYGGKAFCLPHAQLLARSHEREDTV